MDASRGFIHLLLPSRDGDGHSDSADDHHSAIIITARLMIDARRIHPFTLSLEKIRRHIHPFFAGSRL